MVSAAHYDQSAMVKNTGYFFYDSVKDFAPLGIVADVPTVTGVSIASIPAMRGA
jgi:hypothetical protein